MNTKSLQIYQKMKKSLSECGAGKLLPLAEVEWGFHVCLNFWDMVKQEVADYVFDSELAEIHFFKNIKPLFTSEIEYYGLLCHAQLFKNSTSDFVTLNSFWQREVMRLERFVKDNLSFYHYYKNGLTNNDVEWFTRGSMQGESLIKSKNYYHEKGVATRQDYLVSTLMALEKYKIYAENEFKISLQKIGK